jgi:hypothetical protein
MARNVCHQRKFYTNEPLKPPTIITSSNFYNIMKCSTQGFADFCLILTVTIDGFPKLHKLGLLTYRNYGLCKTGT